MVRTNMIVTCVLLGNGVSVLQDSMFRVSVSDDFKRALGFAEFVFLVSFVSFHLSILEYFQSLRYS